MSGFALIRTIWLLFHKSFTAETAKRFDPVFAKAVQKHAKPIYFKIARDAAAVGRKNPMFVNILFAGLVAAFYKAGEGKIAPDQMGQILTDSVESVYLFRRFLRMQDYFSKDWQDRRSAQALESQKRKNPDDFVCEFIYGDTLDAYGITYYECALYKLFLREGCAEIAPLMCGFDYIMAKYMNASLKRTKTIATGADSCDFWYSKKR